MFVANRVQAIHEGSSPDQWFHVDSTDNPADDGSRGVWSKRWLQGPDFLLSSKPYIHHINTELSIHDAEVKCLNTVKNESHDKAHVHTFRKWYSTIKMWA